MPLCLKKHLNVTVLPVAAAIGRAPFHHHTLLAVGAGLPQMRLAPCLVGRGGSGSGRRGDGCRGGSGGLFFLLTWLACGFSLCLAALVGRRSGAWVGLWCY